MPKQTWGKSSRAAEKGLCASYTAQPKEDQWPYSLTVQCTAIWQLPGLRKQLFLDVVSPVDRNAEANDTVPRPVGVLLCHMGQPFIRSNSLTLKTMRRVPGAHEEKLPHALLNAKLS